MSSTCGVAVAWCLCHANKMQLRNNSDAVAWCTCHANKMQLRGVYVLTQMQLHGVYVMQMRRTIICTLASPYVPLCNANETHIHMYISQSICTILLNRVCLCNQHSMSTVRLA